VTHRKTSQHFFNNGVTCRAHVYLTDTYSQQKHYSGITITSQSAVKHRGLTRWIFCRATTTFSQKSC